MATVASRGSTVVATTGSTWASATSGVLCDGAVGTNPATYATFTNAASGGVGTVTIGGYFGAGSIPVGSVPTAISAVVRNFVAATVRWTSITAQLQDSAGTNIGTSQTVALNAAATSVSVTPSAVPTLAQIQAGLRMQITATHSGTTSSVFSLDYVDITVTYSPLSPTGASLSITGGTPIVTGWNTNVVPTGASLSITASTPLVTYTSDLFENLIDNFSVKDTAKWSWGANAGVVSGSLQIAMSTSSVASSISTPFPRNLTNSRFWAQLATGGGLNADGGNNILYVEDGTGGFFYVDVGNSGGSVLVSYNSAAANLGSIAFDAVNHKWFQIRNSGSTMFIEASPTGVAGSWTTLWSGTQAQSTLSQLTHLNGWIYSYWNTGTSPTPNNALWDNVGGGVSPVLVQPTGASLTATTGTPIVSTPIRVTPAGVTLSITGGTPLVSTPVLMQPTAASLSITGGTPLVIIGTQVTPAGASLSITPGTPLVTTPVLVQPAGGALSLTGGTPLVTTPVLVQPAGASLSAIGGTPTVSTPVLVQPAGATLSITGGTPLVSTPVLVQPTGVTLTLSGGTPLVAIDFTVPPAAATATITGGTPLVSTPVLVGPTAASLSITGGTPLVTTGAGVQVVLQGASLSITGGVPLVSTPVTVIPASASLSMTTGTPLVTTPILVKPTGAALALTTAAPRVLTPLLVRPSGVTLTLSGGTPAVRISGTTPTLIVHNGRIIVLGGQAVIHRP